MRQYIVFYVNLSYSSLVVKLKSTKKTGNNQDVREKTYYNFCIIQLFLVLSAPSFLRAFVIIEVFVKISYSSESSV